jgi:hypothetical protein
MLSPDEITNIERGIDAMGATILGLAQQAAVRLTAPPQDPRARPVQELLGFIQALVENQFALGNMALERALATHPDMEKETTDVEA